MDMKSLLKGVWDPSKAWEILKPHQMVKQLVPTDPKSPIPPGHLRFVCISDTHSLTNKLQLPAGDVLLHAGDFTRVGRKEDVEKFEAFLSSLPYKHKVVIAGNHDLSFDLVNFPQLNKRFGVSSDPKFDPQKTKNIIAKSKNCTYLEDSQVTIRGIKIYGSPYQPTFCDWGFNLERGSEIRKVWDKIPNDIDILITHGPPLGHGDFCYSGLRAGCVDLLETIQERVKPKFHVFGHIHEGFGVTTDGHTTYVNASTCTLRYQPTNPAIVFDFPVRD